MKRAVLLVDHGSRRAEANQQLEALAVRLRARLPDQLVVTAHLEVLEPDLGAGLDACVDAGATHVVVHPYFLAPGRHTAEDIPRQVEEAAKRHPELQVRISEPLGLHDLLIDVVIERIEKSG